MSYPHLNTKFEYSLEKEALRVIETLYQMKNGFYKVSGFHVLPYNKPIINSTDVIYLPDIAFHSIPDLWEEVSRIDYANLPIKASKSLTESISNLIDEKYGQRCIPKKLESLWLKFGDEFIEELTRILSINPADISSILVYKTRFGPRVSFDFAVKPHYEIKLFLREDASLQDLLFGITSSLTRNEILNDMKGDWDEAQFVSEWLLYKSSLFKRVGGYIDSQNSYKKVLSRQQSGAIAVKSQKFYENLGLTLKANKFEIIERCVFINGLELANLNNDEKLVMRLLIENRVVSKDILADEMFSDDNDFSLYKISKVIERLRKKLEHNGISGAHIQTIRGIGYVLKK